MQYVILFLVNGLFICFNDCMNSKCKNLTFSSSLADTRSKNKTHPEMTVGIAFYMAPDQVQSAENHRIFPSFFRTQWSISLEFGLTPSGLFSLRLTFELSKSESLRDVSVTRIGDTFPTVFRRPS